MLRTLAGTPIPTILVVAGLLFLFMALGGQLGAKLVTDRVKSKPAGVLGAVLLIGGVAIFLSQLGPTSEVPGSEDTINVEREIWDLEREIEHNENQQREARAEIEHLQPFIETDADARGAIEAQETWLRELEKQREELDGKMERLREHP